MTKFKLFLLIFLFSISLGYSQIIVKSTDMPSSGDKINVSTALTVGSVNYKLTGTNYTWDFTSLQPLSQTVDTFVTVLSTPIYYYPSFILSANQALKQPNINLLVMQMTNVFNFYNNSASSYSMIGYAAQINSIPVPIKYTGADRIYKFPLNYGNTDSSNSVASINIPSLGYFNEIKNRKNTVDGWGTLKTPYGTFPVLRVKSVIYQKDTLHLDTIPFPLPSIVRNITEYKWIGTDFGIPLLEIVETTLGIIPTPTTTITYIDSVRNLNPFGVEKIISNNNISIFPNPANNEFTINYTLSKSAETDIRLFDLAGKEVKILEQSRRERGSYNLKFDAFNVKLQKGIYFVKLKFNTIEYTRKLVIL